MLIGTMAIYPVTTWLCDSGKAHLKLALFISSPSMTLGWYKETGEMKEFVCSSDSLNIN